MAPDWPPSPRDFDGSAYVFAPDDEAGYAQHFREHGFVVVDDILEPEQVKATIEEIWSNRSLLGGHDGLDPQEPRSWDAWPGGARNFLDSLSPLEEVETWRNRVNCKVNRVFDVLWEGLPEILSDEDSPDHGTGATSSSLVMSVDRVGRSTVGWTHAAHQDEAWRKLIERSSPDFQAMQGLLSLEGSRSSGGFVTVVGFQEHFARWAQEHPEGSIPKRTRDMIPFPVPLDDEMQGRRSKILVPSGALLVWDSRLPHENFPNEGEDWRIVQYVTCKRLSSADLEARAKAWQVGLKTGLIPLAFAERFSTLEQIRLGMSAPHSDGLTLAFSAAAALVPEQLEAAEKLRRAYRLKQTAELPEQLKEAMALFREAFKVTPALQEVLQWVAKAESPPVRWDELPSSMSCRFDG
ncbi:unnamed protein product [Cladocopium goreaui]|uniref:Phytanoyl-CoA dioxygenase n=1 Tax=Cladocopium goreaui TaxID=2562237 RepID=A0A9P1CZD8_9DINO|nr:unnamed protein product [Cladocopium goreaui]